MYVENERLLITALTYSTSNVCACSFDIVFQSLTMFEMELDALDAVFSVKAKFPCVHL